MKSLRILESLSLPGTPGRCNEDAMGWTRSACFVLDGATGLGGRRLTGHPGSDAAWLAEMAGTRFAALCESGQYTSDIVRKINSDVRAFLANETGTEPVEDWQYPCAGFEMLRLVGDRLEISGLGDCALYLVNSEGAVFTHTPLPQAGDAEQNSARDAIARIGGLGRLPSLLHDAGEQELLRRSRAGYNKPGAVVWTLGREPDAANHIGFAAPQADFTAAMPLDGLMMSDGFSALCDKYGAYSPAGLVAAARALGLRRLMAELRAIEAGDPDGHAHPRFKQGDDATAILFSLS